MGMNAVYQEHVEILEILQYQLTMGSCVMLKVSKQKRELPNVLFAWTTTMNVVLNKKLAGLQKLHVHQPNTTNIQILFAEIIFPMVALKKHVVPVRFYFILGDFSGRHNNRNGFGICIAQNFVLLI
jgi:hypothetical protein